MEAGDCGYPREPLSEIRRQAACGTQGRTRRSREAAERVNHCKIYKPPVLGGFFSDTIQDKRFKCGNFCQKGALFMLIFRTQFPLPDTIVTKDVWNFFKEWRLTSPYSSETMKSELQKTQAYENISFEDEKSAITTKFLEIEPDTSFFGFELKETDSQGDHWTTHIVHTKNKSTNWLSIEQEKTNPQGHLDYNREKHNKPHFFKNMNHLVPLENIPKEPYVLENTEKDARMISKYMIGEKTAGMPVVYISRTNENEFSSNIDIKKLAEKLYCMAFVFTEPNKSFAYKLKDVSNRRNTYDGAIGIYWGTSERTIIFEEDASIDTIYNKIRSALLSKPVLYNCTWAYMEKVSSERQQKILAKENEEIRSELISVQDNAEEERNKLKKLIENQEQLLKEKEEQVIQLEKSIKDKENEYNRFLETFEPEKKILEEQTEKLKQEKFNLLQKITGLEKKQDPQNGSDIFTVEVKCKERELYTGEISDFIKGILFNGLEKETYPANTNSRQKDVLESLKKENTNLKFTSSYSYRKQERIKNIMKKMKNSKDTINSLIGEGFREKGEPPHQKMFFYEECYLITLASTPSDNMYTYVNNLLSDIKRGCFLCPNDDN
ncbi:MAG: hypothetical protein LBR47_07665 [Spirochaetaceae bacterium]|jgi:hypothetical protein|nr:hypothetical protein [Spirochaetaceae bacterium]